MGHGEQRGASHQNEARSRQHSKGRDSPHACQQAEPHGDEADPAGQQRQPGPADCQPGTQQSAVRPPARLPAAMAVWLRPYQVSPQPQGLFDEHRHTHHQQRAQQQVEGADQGDVLQDLRPFLPEEGPALRQIRSGGLPDAWLPVCLGVWGIWMNSSITAEAKKQAEAPARTGVTPKAP